MCQLLKREERKVSLPVRDGHFHFVIGHQKLKLLLLWQRRAAVFMVVVPLQSAELLRIVTGEVRCRRRRRCTVVVIRRRKWP